MLEGGGVEKVSSSQRGMRARTRDSKASPQEARWNSCLSSYPHFGELSFTFVPFSLCWL
jgi:hypothetical protein